MACTKLFAGLAAAAGCVAFALPPTAPAHHDETRAQAASGSLPNVQWVTNVLEGRITRVKVGTGTSSIIVSVEKTNRQGRRYRGKRIDVDIARGTRLETRDHNRDGRRNAADLAAGDLVVITNRVPKNFAPPLNGFRMLPQLIVAERPAAEATHTETTD